MTRQLKAASKLTTILQMLFLPNSSMLYFIIYGHQSSFKMFLLIESPSKHKANSNFDLCVVEVTSFHFHFSPLT